MAAGAALIVVGIVAKFAFAATNVFLGTVFVGIVLIIRGAATYIDRR